MPDGGAARANPQVGQRAISLLTVCRRAGKLLLGFDAVKEAAQRGQVACVILAADASPKTEKEIRFYAKETPVRRFPAELDMITLTRWFRKKTAVFGVCDGGFAAKLLQILPEDAAAPDESLRSTEM